MTETTSIDQVLDIAIIGAGPGGISAAHALATLGFSIGIFERARALRPIGAALGLSDKGYEALAAINPDLKSQVRALAVNPKHQMLIRPNQEVLFAGESPLAGTPFTWLSWYNLQTCLEKLLPQNVSVNLNHALINVTKNSDRSDAPLCLKFDGKPEVFARLVIGADGYKSVVRSITVADGGPIYRTPDNESPRFLIVG